jgi:hypothetical protein
MSTYCGVVRDGAAWNVDHANRSSTTGWFMESTFGSLCGNGIDLGISLYNKAGRIKSGQILTIEADLDLGTLRF